MEVEVGGSFFPDDPGVTAGAMGFFFFLAVVTGGGGRVTPFALDV